MTGALNKKRRDFPGSPVVKNLFCNAQDARSIPGRGTKIPHAAQCGQKSLKKKYPPRRENLIMKNWDLNFMFFFNSTFLVIHLCCILPKYTDPWRAGNLKASCTFQRTWKVWCSGAAQPLSPHR